VSKDYGVIDGALYPCRSYTYLCCVCMRMQEPVCLKQTSRLLVWLCQGGMRSSCSLRPLRPKVTALIVNTSDCYTGPFRRLMAERVSRVRKSPGLHITAQCPQVCACLCLCCPPFAAAVVPVLVITGFLGSGKTTLVQHLLSTTGYTTHSTLTHG
jgi:hypothetical protein